LGVALALAMTLGVGSASADTQTYVLTALNNPGFTGPYVQVTVNQTGAHTATLTYTALTNGGYTYLLTDGGAVAANGNSGTGTIGVSNLAFTVPNASFTPSLDVQNPPGSDTDDGWGKFNLRVTTGGGGFQSASSISFDVTVTGAGAPTWASAADVLTGN